MINSISGAKVDILQNTSQAQHDGHPERSEESWKYIARCFASSAGQTSTYPINSSIGTHDGHPERSEGSHKYTARCFASSAGHNIDHNISISLFVNTQTGPGVLDGVYYSVLAHRHMKDTLIDILQTLADMPIAQGLLIVVQHSEVSQQTIDYILSLLTSSYTHAKSTADKLKLQQSIQRIHDLRAREPHEDVAAAQLLATL